MDLARVAQHEAWLQWLAGDQTDPEPPPGYRDCRACELRRQFEGDQKGREALCAACPYEDAAQQDGDILPPCPSWRYYYIRELAMYPPEAIGAEWRDIGRRDLRDLHLYRQWLEGRREMMKMRLMEAGAMRRVFGPGESRG